MKKVVGIVSLFLCSFLFMLLLRANFNFESFFTKQTKVEFENDYYNFGELKYGESAMYFFKLKNVGSNPLQISQISSSCDCAVIRWPKIPIPVGERDSIQVVYNTEIVGAFTKDIMVFSNDVEGLQVLYIEGYVTQHN